jgi:hypothetical protein
MNALDAFTIGALADWVQQPDDEDEGKIRAFQAMAVAGKRGQLDELLAEVLKVRRRTCRRCEGEGMIGDGYLCGVCDGSGYDR